MRKIAAALCLMACSGIAPAADYPTKSLRLVKFDIGNNYEVWTVSFDPRDTPQLAAEKKKMNVPALGEPGAAQGWHFLTGSQESIDALTKAAGGKALPIQCDLRDEEQITSAVAQAVESFGGLDILINNASAINLTPTLQTPAKRFDLMFSVNVRATFLTSQAAIPALKESAKAGRWCPGTTRRCGSAL